MLQRTGFAICLAAWPAIAASADIHVPADQPTIQQGIDAAANGDRVLVAPGTYYENIDLNGKLIQVLSTGGAKVTTIDGSQKGSVVTIDSGETRDAVFAGFQVRNGGVPQQNSQVGGGIYIDYASPTIRDNEITQNTACYGGGVFLGGGTSAHVVHNVISSNNGLCGEARGGGIEVDYPEGALIENNLIESNIAGQGAGIELEHDGGWAVVAGNVLIGNQGYGSGALSSSLSRVRLIDNVIAYNGQIGAQILGSYSWSVIDVVNNTFTGQTSVDVEIDIPHGRLAFINNIVSSTAATYWSINCHVGRGHGVSANISHNLVYATAGGQIAGDCDFGHQLIAEDPMFAGGDGGGGHAYWLTAGSPAINAGDNSAVTRIKRDASGAARIIDGTVDLGAYEFRDH